MSSKLLFLHWNDHHSVIAQCFQKCRGSSTLVDCTISAEGQSLKAHKMILATCSSYFEKLFCKEKINNPFINLKDVKFQILEALIDYMYLGELNLPEDQLEDFINTAHSLQIKGLEDFINRYSLRNTIRYSQFVNESLIKSSTLLAQRGYSSSGNKEDYADLEKEFSKMRVSGNTQSECQPSYPQPVFPFVSTILTPGDFFNPETGKVAQAQTSLPVYECTTRVINSKSLEAITEMVTKGVNQLCIKRQLNDTSNFSNKEGIDSVNFMTFPNSLQKTMHLAINVERETIVVSSDEEVEIIPAHTIHKHSLYKKRKLYRFSQKSNTKKKYNGTDNRKKNIYFCLQCRKSFQSASTLRIHEHFSHQGTQQYITLQKCAEVFKWPVNLRGQQFIRQGKLPFVCQSCGRVFRKMKKLKIHQCFYGLGSFVCEVCGVAFNQKVNLLRHLHIHPGALVYVCQLCGKAFSRKIQLQRHEHAHSIIRNNKFKC